MEPDKKNNLRWIVLLTVIIGTFLGRLDHTIVNLALPKMIGDFKISVTAAGWIATAYILANAIFVPIWGKLGDTIGRKKVYIMGFAIFIVGSVLASFSWNLSSMIVFRLIQAIAVSADYPTAMAILAVTFPSGKERAQALGIWSVSFAAASVFGPIIGGPLIDHFNWPSIFWINVPIGLIGLVMAMLFVKESVSEKKTVHFDWWGAIILGISLAALVLVLDQGINWGWASGYSMLCYVITVVFAAIFIKIEQKHPEPIVDLKFFKSFSFVGTILNNFIVFLGMIGMIFLIPIYAETYLNYDATKTGLLFIPMALTMMVSSPIGGSFAGKIQPRYVVAASTFIAAIGILMLTSITPESGAINVIIPLVVMAFGLGFGMAQRTSSITAVVPVTEVGIASSVLALARNIAGAFGIAIFGTIFVNATKTNMASIPAVGNHTVIETLTKQAQINAYDKVFFISAIIMFIGVITAFMIRISKERLARGHEPDHVVMD